MPDPSLRDKAKCANEAASLQARQIGQARLSWSGELELTPIMLPPRYLEAVRAHRPHCLPALPVPRGIRFQRLPCPRSPTRLSKTNIFLPSRILATSLTCRLCTIVDRQRCCRAIRLRWPALHSAPPPS